MLDNVLSFLTTLWIFSCGRWCLGKVGGVPKTGRVVFAPGAQESISEEQRHIGVIAEDDEQTSNVFWFRGSWLKRASNIIDSKLPFAIGDRVQLDPAKWTFNGVKHFKKCLGYPADAAYGLVVRVGSIQRDGSLRNMEVLICMFIMMVMFDLK